MSTNDVPGHNPVHKDKLAMGCWAEHADGSLILVESVEGGRIIYSVFNMAATPPVEYRDAMPQKGFEEHFSFTKKSKKKKDDLPLGGIWTWHDKTPFPWNKIIKEGAVDGIRHACVDDQLNAALRVAKARDLINKGIPVNTTKMKIFADRVAIKGRVIVDKLQRAIGELRS